jgi:hypothetical protein
LNILKAKSMPAALSIRLIRTAAGESDALVVTSMRRKKEISRSKLKVYGAAFAAFSAAERIFAYKETNR